MNPYNVPHGCRILPDGTLCMIRRNPDMERAFDMKYVRIKGERRWYPIENDPIDALVGNYTGQTAYIIGKGPSLDKLTVKDFTLPGPVLAVNESVHKIAALELTNPVYGVQQDSLLKDACLPAKGKLFVSFFARGAYTGNPNVIPYQPHKLGLTRTTLTAAVAVNLAKMLGCKDIVFYGFDAAMTENCDYAKCIGYQPKKYGDPGRFLGHREILTKACAGMDYVFANPATTSASVADKPQQ